MVLNIPLSYYDSLCYYNTDDNISLSCSEMQVKYYNDSISKKQLPEVFCKKGVSKNFAKFTGKHLY